MLNSSESFIAVEYCGGIEVDRGDEIAIVVFGMHPYIQPRLHKLVGWLRIAAHLPAEELDFVVKTLDDVVDRIRWSQGNLFNLRQLENAIRIRGPFSADQFHAQYRSLLLG